MDEQSPSHAVPLSSLRYSFQAKSTIECLRVRPKRARLSHPDGRRQKAPGSALPRARTPCLEVLRKQQSVSTHPQVTGWSSSAQSYPANCGFAAGACRPASRWCGPHTDVSAAWSPANVNIHDGDGRGCGRERQAKEQNQQSLGTDYERAKIENARLSADYQTLFARCPILTPEAIRDEETAIWRQWEAWQAVSRTLPRNWSAFGRTR